MKLTEKKLREMVKGILKEGNQEEAMNILNNAGYKKGAVIKTSSGIEHTISDFYNVYLPNKDPRELEYLRGEVYMINPNTGKQWKKLVSWLIGPTVELVGMGKVDPKTLRDVGIVMGNLNSILKELVYAREKLSEGEPDAWGHGMLKSAQWEKMGLAEEFPKLQAVMDNAIEQISSSTDKLRSKFNVGKKQ